MAIRVALNHKTTYDYDRRVGLSPHVLRLRPAPHCRTPVLVQVTPEERNPEFPHTLDLRRR